ncbi:hypothetical protein BB558_006115, partial [Smittium angustum]
MDSSTHTSIHNVTIPSINNESQKINPSITKKATVEKSITKSNQKLLPFEITLASSFVTMDIMDIKVSPNNSVFGISESGAILNWDFGLNNKLSCETHDNKIKNSQVPETNDFLHPNKNCIDPEPVPKESNQLIFSETIDTKTNMVSDASDKPLIFKGTSQEINLKNHKHQNGTEIVKEQYITYNETQKILKFAEEPKIIKPGIPGLENLTEVNGFYNTSTKSKINQENTNSSNVVCKHCKINNSYIIEHNLAKQTIVSASKKLLAMITESGAVAILNTKRSEIDCFLSPKDPSSPMLSNDKFEHTNYNKNPFSALYSVQNTRKPVEKCCNSKFVFLESPATAMSFGYLLTCDGESKIISEADYNQLVQDKRKTSNQIDISNKDFKKADTFFETNYKLILLVGHMNGSASILHLDSNHLTPLFTNKRRIGKLVQIEIEKQYVYFGYSCGAVSALDNSNNLCQVDLNRPLKAPVSVLSGFGNKYNSYAIVGYNDGTVLILSVIKRHQKEKQIKRLVVLYILSAGSELYNHLHFGESNFNFLNSINGYHNNQNDQYKTSQTVFPDSNQNGVSQFYTDPKKRKSVISSSPSSWNFGSGYLSGQEIYENNSGYESNIYSDSVDDDGIYFSLNKTSEAPKFQWPPVITDKEFETKSSIKMIYDSGAEVSMLYPHKSQITNIKLWPEDNNNSTEKQQGTVNKNREENDGSLNSDLYSVFFVVTSCIDELVRICKISVLNKSLLINEDYQEKEYMNPISGLLIAHLMQNGCNNIDLDLTTGTAIGVRHVANLPQTHDLESERQQNHSLYDQASSQKYTKNETQPLESNEDSKKSFIKISTGISTESGVQETPKPKKQNGGGKKPAYEETILMLSVLDIQHWFFALIVIILKIVIRWLKKNKFLKTVQNFVQKTAFKQSSFRVLMILLNREMGMDSGNDFYGRTDPENIHSNEKRTDRDDGYNFPWLKTNGEWDRIENGRFDQIKIENYSKDFETKPIYVWELWTFNIKLWNENNRKNKLSNDPKNKKSNNGFFGKFDKNSFSNRKDNSSSSSYNSDSSASIKGYSESKGGTDSHNQNTGKNEKYIFSSMIKQPNLTSVDKSGNLKDINETGTNTRTSFGSKDETGAFSSKEFLKDGDKPESGDKPIKTE